MAFPVPYRLPGAWRLGLCTLAPIGLIALCGCSINLGSLSPEPSHEASKPTPAGADVTDAQAYNMRAQALVRSGKTEEALAEFNHAIEIGPHNADALYNRGLLYQGEKQHPLAIDDFSAANGLTPQRAEPLLGRARRSGPPAGSPMNGSATKTSPPVHMPAPSTCIPGTKPREAVLHASAASPARATNESIRTGVCVLRQYRVKHRFSGRQHVLGHRRVFAPCRRFRRLGAQIQRGRSLRDIGRRYRPAGIVDPGRARVGLPHL
jgi:tetratricopeptide (TPR) repeat protein